jgi:hypothetical protein
MPDRECLIIDDLHAALGRMTELGRSIAIAPSERIRAAVQEFALRPLSANKSETRTPDRFSVEGGGEKDDDWGVDRLLLGRSDRGGGQGDETAVHGGV